jgi:uncharacterized membrane protein YtjA (UPF0391 family)
MIFLSVIFFMILAASAVVGFGWFYAGFAWLFRILFWFFLIAFIVTLILGLFNRGGRQPTNKL